MNGKGDKARPMKVSRDKFNDSFDRIFGGKDNNPAEIGVGKERTTSKGMTIVDSNGERITVFGGY